MSETSTTGGEEGKTFEDEPNPGEEVEVEETETEESTGEGSTGEGSSKSNQS